MIADIRKTNAVGDGETMNTQIIQQMIDECSAAGGGSVIIAGGRYMTGTIELKNGVDLHIEADGVLRRALTNDAFWMDHSRNSDSLIQVWYNPATPHLVERKSP